MEMVNCALFLYKQKALCVDCRAGVWLPATTPIPWSWDSSKTLKRGISGTELASPATGQGASLAAIGIFATCSLVSKRSYM